MLYDSTKAFWAVIGVIFMGSLLLIGVNMANRERGLELQRKPEVECNQIAFHTGYSAVLDQGICWITLDEGVTLPWDDAKELIKFQYTADVSKRIQAENERVEIARAQALLKKR